VIFDALRSPRYRRTWPKAKEKSSTTPTRTTIEARQGIFLRKIKIGKDELHLTMQWVRKEYNDSSSGDESWVVVHYGPPKEIAECLERWLPKCPDPELMQAALDKLDTEIPKGWL
jgi:hypothetical protein